MSKPEAGFRGTLPDYQPHFHSYPTSTFNRDIWETTVLGQSHQAAKRMWKLGLNEFGQDNALPALPWGNAPRNANQAILSDIYRSEVATLEIAMRDLSMERRESLLGRKGGFYSGLGRDIRRKKQFHLIGSLQEELNRAQPHLEGASHALLRFGIFTLYLMICDPDRFLVGLKNGVHWKKVDIPTDKEYSEPNVLNMASHYVPMLAQIGKGELEVVPTSLILPTDFEKITVPKPISAVDELLEDAYFRQRYLVPPDGADIRFRKAGDLGRIFMIRRGAEVIARVMTTYGDELVIINLNDGSFTSPNPHWAQIVAETYRDLVTADEVSSTHYRSLRTPSTPEDSTFEKLWNLDDPQVIYIPRQVRIKRDGDFRPPYEGPVRPVKPHMVTNHFRTANMSQRHYEEILELEREWGLQPGEIADNIPPGKTWVRPHFSPSGSEVVMRTGPIFIKRRILTSTGIKLPPVLGRSFYD